MTLPRASQIILQQTPYYHCVSRCVRRAFLCGTDRYTEQSYEHRRLWLLQRIRQLTQAFTIDIAAYAIMSNHYHLVLHVDQQKAEALNEQQIAKRWTSIFAGNKVVERYLAGNQDVAELAQATLALWRQRLHDISWFMRCLNEHIARKANKEDGCKGRFWEGRYKSQPLVDEKALLGAMVYVDLNPIRAKIAKHITDSEYTSAYERIHGQACKEDTQAYSHALMSFMTSDTPKQAQIPCTQTAYMALLDWAGRIAKANKRGKIQNNQPPLLDILAFNPEQWTTVCTELGKVTHGPIGSAANVSQFNQKRGMKRPKPSKTLNQLFN